MTKNLSDSEKLTEKLKWRVLDRQAIFDSPIFSLFRSERQLSCSEAANKVGIFYYLDAKNWVNVIPLIFNEKTQQYDVILVEQFRHGSQQLVLEFPAGIVDEGEEPQQCALRELAEETGYSAVTRCEQIGVSYPNPAIMSNQVFTYAILLDSATQPAALQLDELEALRTHRLPLIELKQLICTQKSAFNNALMLQSLFWLENSSIFSDLFSQLFSTL